MKRKTLSEYYRKQIVRLSEKSCKIYTFVSLMSMAAVVFMLAFADISIKSMVYPLWYEVEETEGVITAEYTSETDVRARRWRTTTFSFYFYLIDGVEVPVNVSQVKEYDVGDIMPYYRYERNSKAVGDIIKYTPLRGILTLLLNMFVFRNAWLFWTTKTKEDKAKKKEPENSSQSESSGRKEKKVTVALIVSFVLYGVTMFVLLGFVWSLVVLVRGIMVTLM